MIELSKFVDSFDIMKVQGFVNASNDLDGAGIRRWLEANGIKCSSNGDMGRHGLVVTEDGYCISTSGYCIKP